MRRRRSSQGTSRSAVNASRDSRPDQFKRILRSPVLPVARPAAEADEASGPTVVEVPVQAATARGGRVTLPYVVRAILRRVGARVAD